SSACGLPAVKQRFRPHVGIAYSNRDTPAEPIIQRVTALRDLPPAEVSVTDLRLVRLYRDGRTYQWDTVAVVSLSA
ncbi:2'-5' RNA ligase family protein, partial [Frankia sp. AvcI1]